MDRLRRRSFPCSFPAPYTVPEIGHREPEYAAAAIRVLQGYVDAAADTGAHHISRHLGSIAPGPEDLSRETLVRNLVGLLKHPAKRRTVVTVEPPSWADE